MDNIAHISQDGRIQTNTEHLNNVAEYCGVNAGKIGLGACGRLAGKVHDMGKYRSEFVEYICDAHRHPEKNRRGPDHAAIGAVYVQKMAEGHGNAIAGLTAQLISMVVMWHHGGLGDIRDFTGGSPYLARLGKFNDAEGSMCEEHRAYNEAAAKFERDFSAEEIKKLFDDAVEEIAAICQKIEFSSNSGKERIFFLGLVCKFLYSCLIDADRYDAAMFEDNNGYAFPEKDNKPWEKLIANFEEKYSLLTGKKDGSSEIDLLRTQLSESCRQTAYEPAGIYTLNCPTGSGKTLSSLRYALHHAKHVGKDRVFYIIPLISIIEQNSRIIRDFLGDEDAVLELHSAIEPEVGTAGFNDGKHETCAKEHELLSERMDKPVVVTTMVRFLNTFFKGNTRGMRAIHNFADSLIIFDEIQTIPVKCIGMFNSLINFLVHICNATVVLSTATQIVLDRQHGDERPLMGLSDIEISKCTGEMRDKFIRVDYDTSLLYGNNTEEKQNVRANSLDKITERIKNESIINDSILCIFNTKRATELVYDDIVDMQRRGVLDSEINIYFLTTGICPAHRSERIERIRKELEAGNRIIVISTQLIEAGVDVSFDIVFRSLAGLDSVIQAAGRCNREGKKAEHGRVILIQPSSDIEDLSHLSDIVKGRAATAKLLYDFNNSPDKYGNRIDSQKAIEQYFDNYLEDQGNNLTYPFKIMDVQGTLYMYDVLANNSYSSTEGLFLNQAFATAGKAFEPIDAVGIPVVVSYGKGKQLISELLSSRRIDDKRALLRKLQKYTINIACFHEKEIAEYAVMHEETGIYVLREGYYDELKGFIRERHLEAMFI